MPKKNLRETMLSHRRALSLESWTSRSNDVQQRLLESSLFARAGNIALYAPVNREVDTARIFKAAMTAGMSVLFPAVSRDTLLFREVTGAADLTPGVYGIAEPREDCPERRPEEIDLIIVPGAAFDRNGQRLGYGKGYYDRTLHRLERTGRLAGFAFDFQLVDNIVAEPHDVALDLIITEQQILSVRSSYKGGRHSED